MSFFQLEPDVAGGIGENTVLDNTVWPPLIHHLNYEIEDWDGDAILEGFPVFIITERAQTVLTESDFSGMAFKEVEITVSQECALTKPNLKLPKFTWLVVEGVAGSDDFGMSAEHRLIVSEKVLQVLRNLGIPHAEVEPHATFE